MTPPTGRVFDCEIQARFRDLNLGWHIDSAEVLRIIDEARIQLLMFAPVFGEGAPLLRRKDPGVIDLMGSQRIDYRAEMRFAPYAPFLLRLWICHAGRTSFTVATELRTAADHPPAVVAESTMVFWDKEADAAWPMSAEVREDLDAFAGPRVGLR